MQNENHLHLVYSATIPTRPPPVRYRLSQENLWHVPFNVAGVMPFRCSGHIDMTFIFHRVYDATESCPWNWVGTGPGCEELLLLPCHGAGCYACSVFCLCLAPKVGGEGRSSRQPASQPVSVARLRLFWSALSQATLVIASGTWDVEIMCH